jgi:sigma-B regulation protein RsbU (phosphoserine phosphatase)
MNSIVHRSLRAVRAEQGVITLLDRTDGNLAETLVRIIGGSASRQPLRPDQNLLGWMQINKGPLILNDPPNDDRFPAVAWDGSIRSVLSAPLLIKSELRGVLTVYNKRGHTPFTDDDARLLTIIATQSAQVIENARLYEEEQVLHRMQDEVGIAAEIQHQLLPESPPHIPGYDLAGVSIPAEDVGGDYFDFIPMDRDRLAVCLGDICGKGLPAAMLMANLQATIRGHTLLNPRSKDCLQHSNRLLYHCTAVERFATLFHGVLDFRRHVLTYSNAGHVWPLLFASGRRLRLDKGGTALGFFEDVSFEEEEVALNPGDVLVVFSDGITESLNRDDEEYGEERLTALVQDNLAQSAADLIESITAAARQHAGGRSQSDDMTLLVIRRE